MSYYRIDWDSLNQLPAGERMSALAHIHASVRRVIGAERARIAHRALAEHGSMAAAARELQVQYSRFPQILKENPMDTVTVTVSTVEPTELHHQYPHEHGPQPCYVEVDLENRHVAADWNPEIGNAIPARVFHGFARRYPIPALTSTATNELLAKIRPLAERMVADWDERPDRYGNNMKAVLGDDAQAAEEEVEALCGHPADWGGGHWDASDMVTVWDIDSATTGDEAEEYGITPATTDERLEEIEEEIRQLLADVSDSDEVVLEGIDEYLAGLRDDQRLNSDNPHVWAQALDALQEEKEAEARSLAGYAIQGWLAGVELAAAQPGPDEQGRVRIAAACGWVLHHDEDEGWLPTE